MIHEPSTTHQMRERLTGIMGRIQLAERAALAGEIYEVRVHLDKAMSEAHSLAALVAEVEKL